MGWNHNMIEGWLVCPSEWKKTDVSFHSEGQTIHITLLGMFCYSIEQRGRYNFKLATINDKSIFKDYTLKIDESIITKCWNLILTFWHKHCSYACLTITFDLVASPIISVILQVNAYSEFKQKIIKKQLY